MKNTLAIILAAGKGTRMKSSLPKPIVPVKGKPIVKHIIDSFRNAGVTDIALIVGYQSEKVKETLGPGYIYVEQQEQKGTAHAILQAKKKVNWKERDVFVFVGDSPLITSHTIQELIRQHRSSGADCTFLTADFKMDLPYARVIKDADGRLIKCVEEKNASPVELEVTELLSSHFIFKGDLLFKHIEEIQPDPENGEYYLTDILQIFLDRGYKVRTLEIEDYKELVGLNTPEDLAWAEELIDQRKL